MPKNTLPRSRRAAAPKKVTAETIAARQPKSAVAATLDLKDSSDAERAFLATCQKIYRRDHGCVTPFEQFFWGLVVLAENDLWPTPDRVACELATFRDDFDDMDKWARVFVETYPTPAGANEPPEDKASPRKPRKKVAHA